MSDDDDDKMSPENGLEGIQELMNQVASLTEQGNLAGMEDVLERLNQIVTETGIEVPGMTDRLDLLKGQSSSTQHLIENTDAAMWVGDLARAEDLSFAGPELDLGAFFGDDMVLDDLDDDEIADEEGQDEGDEDFDESELAEFLTSRGIDVPDFEAAPPDLYEDIAEGKRGAIDAFIASGEDPNIPRSAGLHTALLAALDAPNRRAESIEKLMKAGADAQVIHSFGDNALSWAAGYHHPETVTADTETALMTLLAGAGVDPNHVTAAGNWTILHRAIIQGDAARVAAMLAAGADPAPHVFPDFQPEKLANFTCAMLAAPKPEALQVLIDHGVDPLAPDGLGRDPVKVIEAEARAARARADESDPWTIAHAVALETSLGILKEKARKA